MRIGCSLLCGLRGYRWDGDVRGSEITGSLDGSTGRMADPAVMGLLE
jgi:hypothetical protein